MVDYHGEADYLDRLGSVGVRDVACRPFTRQDEQAAFSQDKSTYNCAQAPDIIRNFNQMI